MTPVDQNPANICHVPFIVFLLLQKLDPHIRDGHGKTVVETNTPQSKWETQRRHSRDVLGDSNRFRVDVMKHFIGL